MNRLFQHVVACGSLDLFQIVSTGIQTADRERTVFRSGKDSRLGGQIGVIGVLRPAGDLVAAVSNDVFLRCTVESVQNKLCVLQIDLFVVLLGELDDLHFPNISAGCGLFSAMGVIIVQPCVVGVAGSGGGRECAAGDFPCVRR